MHTWAAHLVRSSSCRHNRPSIDDLCARNGELRASPCPRGRACDRTNARWPNPDSPTAQDYNYDQSSGVDYSVDVANPVGSSITGLGGGMPVF